MGFMLHVCAPGGARPRAALSPPADGADGQAWTFSPSYTFYSGERLGGYVEAGFGHGEGGEQVAGGGLTWRASPRVQLDLSVLRGLDADSVDWQGGFGVSVALR